MINIIKIIKSIIFIVTATLLLPFKVEAVCPVCTVAVGAGLGFSRYLGIDDLVSSVWIGGLLMSLSYWTKDWILKKKSDLKNPLLLAVLLWYVLTIIPLMFAKIIGHPDNSVWGIDKIVLGIIIGTIIFISSVLTDKKLRQRNNEKVYFPYQKVIIPFTLLSLTSITIYILL